jgi:hypothetical protein
MAVAIAAAFISYCCSVMVGFSGWCVSLHPYCHLLSIESTGNFAPIQVPRRFVRASDAVQGGPV